MKTRVLIAEDEPLMRERLITQLAKLWPKAEIVMVAENGNDAWDGFLEHEPALVFLDIRMPGLSGIEVAQKIGQSAHIVFITAYDQYAIDAFDAGAIDYLLKPVQEERLQKAIHRVQEKMQTRMQAESSEPRQHEVAAIEVETILRGLQASMAGGVPGTKSPKMKWIKASVGKQIKLIDVDEVLFFQSDTKYTRVVLADYEALLRTPLKDLLGSLDGDQFWQIHRSTVVNARAISAAERVDAERMQVFLKGHPEKLLVSRNFTYLFRE
ncbi:LytR/AlgR family response regulator transcription factor [Undibacterium flavidum]|uniref:Response regulator transcription factor n=1 Tax=Undibacterium flavidum TaxID=2762297 RepID=A0ABR6Y8N7_9BURK|nr:LytTR family DNA-binding domain-containing protein [Undibacterium flavidum]MBC3872975.1 response regulator transcription factor [Undibacterium flavidum]